MRSIVMDNEANRHLCEVPEASMSKEDLSMSNLSISIILVDSPRKIKTVTVQMEQPLKTPAKQRSSSFSEAPYPDAKKTGLP